MEKLKVFFGGLTGPNKPANQETPSTKITRLVKNSVTLSVASILCGITALPAIIYSIGTLLYIRKHGPNPAAFYKTAIALFFSSAVFATVIFAIASALDAAKAEAQEINCINHMKQLIIGIKCYSGDNNDRLPPFNHWCDAIKTNAPAANLSDEIFRCPASKSQSRCDFAMNINLNSTNSDNNLSPDTVLLFESIGGWNQAGGPELAKARHHDRVVVGFMDGSVNVFKVSDLGTLHWIPGTNSPASPVN